MSRTARSRMALQVWRLQFRRNDFRLAYLSKYWKTYIHPYQTSWPRIKATNRVGISPHCMQKERNCEKQRSLKQFPTSSLESCWTERTSDDKNSNFSLRNTIRFFAFRKVHIKSCKISPQKNLLHMHFKGETVPLEEPFVILQRWQLPLIPQVRWLEGSAEVLFSRWLPTLLLSQNDHG